MCWNKPINFRIQCITVLLNMWMAQVAAFLSPAKYWNRWVGSVQEQKDNFLSKLKNTEKLLDWQTSLYTAWELFCQHHDLNTDDEHQQAQFIMQHPNLKQAGLLEVQSLMETDKAIIVIVLPVEGTTWNAISAIAIQHNLRDKDVSLEICFLKGGFLTKEQATASMMIINPGIVVNPHLPGNLQHCNQIVWSPENSHSLDSISVITDYTQSTAANFSENSLPELSISTVDPQQVSDTIPCTNSFAALSDSTDDMNNMLAPVCTGDLAIKFCQHYSAKSSNLSSLYHSPTNT